MAQKQIQRCCIANLAVCITRKAVPQSMQSVPMSQELNSEPHPPSSQLPSVEYVHVFVHTPVTTWLETAIATAATRRIRCGVI